MINNDKEFNETVDKFEPMTDFEMSNDDMENMRTNALVSIAISLKRIADKLNTPIAAVELTEDMREEWEKANQSAGYALFNKS